MTMRQGRAFDKVARLLGLGYPVLLAIQAAAEGGDGRRFKLPKDASSFLREAFIPMTSPSAV